MEFEWDESKRLETLRVREVDVVYVAQMFKGHVVESVDDRFEYGETRYRALGQVNNEVFVLIFTRRHNLIRLITAWKAGKDATRQYEESKPRPN
jgi:uncharacterized protein